MPLALNCLSAVRVGSACGHRAEAAGVRLSTRLSSQLTTAGAVSQRL
ncbi:hypothetical protein I546_6547 [Mycobacterium kansasii 732]|nr:hypothetical protein I546_6547 [Mycobacterium kansasii 732]